MQVVHTIDNTFLVYKFEGDNEDDLISLSDQLEDLGQWFVDC